MSKIITIDCDNVLSNTTKAFIDYYREFYGESVDYELVVEPYFGQNDVFSAFAKDESEESYMKFFDRGHEEKKTIPLPGAQSCVKELQKQGYELHVLSGRTEKMRGVTEQWIEEYFPGCFSSLQLTQDMTDSHVTKGSICQKLGCDMHIDDFFHYASTIADVGIKSLLFDSPRNRDKGEHEHIVRVSGWEEVLPFVNSLSL